MSPDPALLTPAQGATFAGDLTDPWPTQLEGPDGLSLRFLETDGNQLAIYINDAAGHEQVDVYRVDGTYRMDAQNG